MSAPSDREPRRGHGPLPAFVAAATLVLVAAAWIGLSSDAVPVAITVPYSSQAVSDGDLDGDPSTGAWGDALMVTIPLETGGPEPFGTAQMYIKHDGSSLYTRIDGNVDVPWAGATDDHFWLGVQISSVRTTHHGGSEWDGMFMGLWNGEEYGPPPAYPPPAIDTHGFDRPPARDTVQNVLGALGTSGASSPYGFTAEWKRALSSGDGDDLAYQDDGATTYNFFVTIDSDGDGSGGGSLSHREVTNLNTMRIAPGDPTDAPPTITHDPPLDPVAGEAIPLTVRVVDATGVAAVYLNYTNVSGGTTNATLTASGDLYFYTLPAQAQSGTVVYTIEAVDLNGNAARSGPYTLQVTRLLDVPRITDLTPVEPVCLELTWTAVQDAGLAGYRVYRWNGTARAMEMVGETAPDETVFLDCALEADQAYRYWVVAFDEEGNESPPSLLADGRTLGTGGPSTPLLANPAVLTLLGIAVVATALLAVRWLWVRGPRR